MNFKIALAAAAVVGLAGTAQAADLAKKAPAAADYVKVCDAYGAGFFYIPGSDTCLKIGGYVRAELRTGAGNNTIANPGAGMHLGGNRVENNINTRARFLLNLDARTNTELGLLRSFIEIRETISTGNNGNNTVDLYQGFVQFAGLTAGRANSFFDFVQGGYTMGSVIETDNSDHRINLFAYTFSFGNGISATLSVEDQTTSDGGVHLFTGAQNRGPYSAVKMPDVVANVAIAQAWGRAQVMAALHQDYSSALVAGGANSDKLGYAFGAGVEVNLPMLAAGDKLFLQGIYSKGAIGYALQNAGGLLLNPVDFVTNGVSIFQSTAWSISGGIHHEFSKALEANFGASYAKYDGRVVNTDFSQVVLNGEIRWKPVAGLYIAPAIEYRTVDYSARGVANGNQWVGLVRVQRNF